MLRRSPTILRALSALLLPVLGACSEGEAARGGFEPEPVVVEILELRTEELREIADLTGQLDAELSVRVRPDMAGILESIEFTEGESVKEGDVLFRLRRSEETARLREAEAERDLKKVVFDRTQMLKERDISSVAQLDRARAELQREEARVAAARADLERTTIVAPFDGEMGALFVSPGARIEPDVVLTQIDKVDRLQIVLSLPEIAVGLVRPGIPFEFTVAPYGERKFLGEIYFIAPTLDPATRRMLVKGWVPNEDRSLRPGLFATIKAEVARREGALVLPESALALDREGTFVWRVAADDTAERVSVTTGFRSAGRVEITEGLAAGDRVVTAGTNKVRRGSALRAAAPRSSTGDPVRAGDARPTAARRGGDGEGS